ncbi:hypothetical protein GA0115242_127519 [Streptomyces sp. SolWspMP-5a-2]|nr:hypothetical protein GA0115242_127519 [Streptomyces sp. SolWspMP-5a-2]
MPSVDSGPTADTARMAMGQMAKPTSVPQAKAEAEAEEKTAEAEAEEAPDPLGPSVRTSPPPSTAPEACHAARARHSSLQVYWRRCGSSPRVRGLDVVSPPPGPCEPLGSCGRHDDGLLALGWPARGGRRPAQDRARPRQTADRSPPGPTPLRRPRGVAPATPAQARRRGRDHPGGRSGQVPSGAIRPCGRRPRTPYRADRPATARSLPTHTHPRPRDPATPSTTLRPVPASAGPLPAPTPTGPVRTPGSRPPPPAPVRAHVSRTSLPRPRPSPSLLLCR